MSVPSLRRFGQALFLAFPAFLPGSARAQEEVPPRLQGQVLAGSRPAAEGMVVLHRVSATESGEIDSVRVGADGSFELLLPYVPDHATRPEIFFASFLFGGLAYFGPAVTEASQLDSLYLIQAYDTLSVPPGGAPLPVRVRNLFLESTQDGWAVTDLFQIINEGDRTLYSPEEGVIWSYPLPGPASGFEVGQADLSPDALRLQNGRMEVLAPLQPGERFLLVRYDLGVKELEIPLPGRTDRLEIMVREPAPPAEFPPLLPAPPVELEPGNVYRRYVGEALADTVIRALVAPEPWRLPAHWIAVFLAAALGGAGVYGFRRKGGLSRPAFEIRPHRSRQDLLLAVARLDEEFARSGDTSPAGRESYRIRREELFAEINRSS